MLELVLIALRAAILACVFTLLLFFLRERRKKLNWKKSELEAESNLQRLAEEDERKSRAMDEGFDNLMRYSVRGQDGFGGMK